MNLVPKKRNWDLKRDISGRLAKLDKKTQSAIVELLRQRAQEQGNDGEESSDDDEDGSSGSGSSSSEEEQTTDDHDKAKRTK